MVVHATSTVYQATKCIAVDTTVCASESRADIMTMMMITDARVADTTMLMMTTIIGEGVENIMMTMMTITGAKLPVADTMMMMITREGVENTISMDAAVADMAVTTGAREASMITGAREEDTSYGDDD